MDIVVDVENCCKCDLYCLDECEGCYLVVGGYVCKYKGDCFICCCVF